MSELIERAARAASIAWENADDGPDEWPSVVRAVLAEAQPPPLVPAGADVAEVLAGLVEEMLRLADELPPAQAAGVCQARWIVQAAQDCQAATGARAAGGGTMDDELQRLRKVENAARTYFTVRGPAVIAAARALQDALALPSGVVAPQPPSAAPPAPSAPGVAELLALCEDRMRSAHLAYVDCHEIVRLLSPGGADGT